MAESGQTEAAGRLIRQALDQKRGSRRDRYAGWILLADIYAVTGDYHRAIQALETAYRLMIDPLPLLHIIRLQIQQGDTAGALQTLRLGRERFPKDDRFPRQEDLIRNRAVEH
jgi:tetratricopeptide (TPR) repeat protein